MSANIVTLTAKALYDQLMIVKEAEGQEFEKESAKMQAMSQGAQQIANLAEQEVKLIIGTNIIPQDSMLVAGIKDINPKRKGLFIEEITKS